MDRLLTTEQTDSETPTAEFFRTIGDIRGKISELHSKMKGDGTGDESSLKALFTQQHTQVIVRDEDRKWLSETIETRVSEIHGLTKDVQQRLKKLKEETDEYENTVKESPSTQAASDIRMRNSQQQALLKRTNLLVEEFMDMQTVYKANRRKTVARQVDIAVGKGTSAEQKAQIVDECLETGQSAFLQSMHGGARAEQALRDVTDKHAAIMKLERSIGEVAEMFQDLALLVESQGAVLDRIESNVDLALDYTKDGVAELEKANKYAKKNRKKKCFLLLLMLLVLCVILGPILLQSGGSA